MQRRSDYFAQEGDWDRYSAEADIWTSQQVQEALSFFGSFVKDLEFYFDSSYKDASRRARNQILAGIYHFGFRCTTETEEDFRYTYPDSLQVDSNIEDKTVILVEETNGKPKKDVTEMSKKMALKKARSLNKHLVRLEVPRKKNTPPVCKLFDDSELIAYKRKGRKKIFPNCEEDEELRRVYRSIYHDIEDDFFEGNPNATWNENTQKWEIDGDSSHMAYEEALHFNSDDPSGLEDLFYAACYRVFVSKTYYNMKCMDTPLSNPDWERHRVAHNRQIRTNIEIAFAVLCRCYDNMHNFCGEHPDDLSVDQHIAFILR